MMMNWKRLLSDLLKRILAGMVNSDFLFLTSRQTFEYFRVDNINKTWRTLVEASGVVDVQLKDLRTYFNHRLTSEFGFSAKEAGAYIGNSEIINKRHYTPVSMDVVKHKLGNVEQSGMNIEMSPSCHPKGKIPNFQPQTRKSLYQKRL